MRINNGDEIIAECRFDDVCFLVEKITLHDQVDYSVRAYEKGEPFIGEMVGNRQTALKIFKERLCWYLQENP